MKNLLQLLFILIVSLFIGVSANAQCNTDTFTQNFDASFNIPSCWTSDVSGFYASVLIDNSHSNSGTNSVRLKKYWDAETAAIISPELNTLSSAYRLKFWIYNDTYTSTPLLVGTADASGTFTLFDTIMIPPHYVNNSSSNITVDFNAYTGSDTRIMIKLAANADMNSRLDDTQVFLDDIVWESNAEPVATFTQTFDDSTTIPSEWASRVIGNNASVEIGDDFSSSGTNSVRLRLYAPTETAAIISPELTTLGSAYRLKFWAKNGQATSTALLVGTADAAGTFTLFNTITLAGGRDTNVIVDFNTYTGSDTRLMVKSTPNANSYANQFYTDIFLDDMVWELIPTCEEELTEPTAQLATNITTTTADLGWTENGKSTTWDIEWGTEGFTPSGTPTITGTTTNPHSLTGLNSNSSYEFYVRSNCANSSSTWAGPFSFTTLCEQNEEVYLSNVGFYSSGTNDITSNLPTTVNYNTSNPNNYMSPGKNVRFKVECFNNLTNGKNLVSAECKIETTNPNISITDASSGLNNVAYGSSAWSTDEFEISIAANVQPGTIITFKFTVKDNISGAEYITDCIDFVVAPLWPSGENIDDDSNPDSKGNNNQIVESGETIEFLPLLENVSPISAGSVLGRFFDPNDCPDLNVWDDVTGVSGTVSASSFWNIKFGVPANIEPGETNMVPEFDFVFDYNKAETYKFDMGLDMAGLFSIFPGKATLVKWDIPYTFNPNSPDAPACDGSVGVEENKWVNDLKITPNPSSGSIQINGNLNISEEYTISVIDVRGKVIYESTDRNNLISKTIDLTFAKKGIYMVKISNNTYFKYEKIILTD